MEWFYSKGNKKLGPVTAAELLEVSAQDDFPSEVLVWTEGMADWMVFERVRPRVIAAVLESDSGLVQCAFSGTVIPKDEALEYGDQLVLPEHKDQFVQQLAEGHFPDPNAVAIDEYGSEIRFGVVLRRAWDIFRVNFFLLMLIHFSVWLLLDQLTAYMDATVFAEMDEMANFQRSMNFERFLNSMFGIIATAAFFRVCMSHNDGRKSTYGEAMKTGFGLWGKMWVTRFIQGFFLFGGLFVCMLPMVFLIVGVGSEPSAPMFLPIILVLIILPLLGWFISRIAFSLPFLAETGIWAFPAMKKSFALTKGRVWRIIGYYCLMTLILIIPILLPIMVAFIPGMDSPIPSGIFATISGFVSSFFIVFTYAFYKQVRISIGEDGLDS